MRRVLIALFLTATMAVASNFSEAIKLYKSGDLTEAKKYFEQAYHDDGVETAGYFLGIYYAEGLAGVDKDYQKAKIYLEPAVRSGNVRAKCALAKIYRLEERPEMAQHVLGDIDQQTCERLTSSKRGVEHATKNEAKKD